MHVNIYFLSALAGVIALAWETWQHFRKTHSSNIEEIVNKAIAPVLSEIAVMKTMIEPMWMNYNHQILNQSAVLHHPEPSRARVDYLLDRLTAETITPDEVNELREDLAFIMRWEEGTPAPYKIFQGEQASAATLLSALSVVYPEIEE